MHIPVLSYVQERALNSYLIKNGLVDDTSLLIGNCFKYELSDRNRYYKLLKEDSYDTFICLCFTDYIKVYYSTHYSSEEDMQIDDMPCFKRITKSFLAMMEQIEVKEYEKALKEWAEKLAKFEFPK